jgi:hypothetical protein
MGSGRDRNASSQVTASHYEPGTSVTDWLVLLATDTFPALRTIVVDANLHRRASIAIGEAAIVEAEPVKE